MNKCPNCGNKLSEIDVLCPKCGAFVEVVQLGNGNITSAEIAASKDQPSVQNNNLPHDPRPDIILYDDEFPKDILTEADIDFALLESQANGLDDIADTSGSDIINDADIATDFSIKKDPVNNASTQNDDRPAPVDDHSASDGHEDTQTPKVPPIDESVYSESYLNTIKNMKLPEVEDLSKFDPEAFLNKYKQSKKLSTPSASFVEAPQGTESLGAEKRWLELEEAEEKPVTAQDLYKIPAEKAPIETIAATEPDEPEKTEDPLDSFAERHKEERVSRNDFLSGTTTTLEKQSRKKFHPALAALFWVVLAAALFFGFIFINNYVADTYGTYSNMVDEITNGKVILDTGEKFVDTTSVLVTETKTKDGSSAHLFSIDTAAGKSVTLLPLKESFPLTDGQVNIVVPDETLIKALGVVTSENLHDTDALLLKVQTDEEQYTYPLDVLTLVLENTHYVRASPTQSFFSTTDSATDVIITVLPGTSISINDVDYTGEINAHGILTAHLGLTLGDNAFKIDAVHPGNAAVADAFTVTRQISQTTLSPATEYLRVYADVFTCYGTTDADAHVTAFVGDSYSYSALVDDNGAYAISCTIEGYGLHDITISAVSDDHGDASTNLYVEFVPEVNSFVLDAQTFSVKNTPGLPDTLIRISGTVSELSSNVPTLSFSLTDNTGNLPCYYHGTSLLEAGKEYTIYGMFDELTDSFYAMYVL